MPQGNPRMYKNSKSLDANKRIQKASARKAERYSELGKEFENFVANILSKIAEKKKIFGFTQNPANSSEDRQGKDFTVWVKKENDEVSTRSFGVTISHKSWNDSRLRHPDIPQFFFPLETKPETIEKKILDLFNS